MSQSENVSYKEIHAYMIQKTQEYYLNPPAVLVEAVISLHKSQGEDISYEEAQKQVTLIDIQRYLKQEMTKKWPEFMGKIKSNSLPENNR